jgi:pimeloyl-[acyl-carrier protein] methyl ester esterase
MRELAALLSARGTPPSPALAAGLALLHDTDLRDEVPSIDLPAAVIHGGRDVLTPVGAGRWLAGRLPFARLTEIPEAAHLPFVSHPGAVAEALECLRDRGASREEWRGRETSREECR